MRCCGKGTTRLGGPKNGPRDVGASSPRRAEHPRRKKRRAATVQAARSCTRPDGCVWHERLSRQRDPTRADCPGRDSLRRGRAAGDAGFDGQGQRGDGAAGAQSLLPGRAAASPAAPGHRVEVSRHARAARLHGARERMQLIVHRNPEAAARRRGLVCHAASRHQPGCHQKWLSFRSASTSDHCQAF